MIHYEKHPQRSIHYGFTKPLTEVKVKVKVKTKRERLLLAIRDYNFKQITPDTSYAPTERIIKVIEKLNERIK